MSGLAGGIRAGKAFIEILADDQTGKGLRTAQAKLKVFQRGVAEAGRAMTTMAAGAVIPAALSTRLFSNFDDEMRAVKAVTGATAGEFAMLTEEARRLGSATSFTATQVAAMMTELGRAGFRPGEIMAATDSILALGRATRTELAQAAQIAGGVLRGFNLEASESGRVADVLTAAANGSAQTLEEFGEAMKMVAPIASEAGDSLEETAAAIGILANNGIRGTLAGTAVARAYKNLSEAARQTDLKKMGIDVVDAIGNMRPLADILNDIATRAQKLGSGERLALFEKMFGRGQAAALKLAGSSKAFDHLLATLKNAQGVAKKTADEMDDGIGGSFRKGLSVLQEIGLSIGKAISGPVKNAVDSLRGFANWLSEAVKGNAALVRTVVRGAVVLGLMGVSLLGVAGATSLAASAVGAFTNLLALSKKVMVASTVVAHGLRTAMLAMAATNPVLLGLSAVAAVAVAVAVAVKAAKSEVKGLSSAMSEQRAKGDALRQDHQDMADRLDELARKQSLTNAEMDEAESLVTALEAAYGKMSVVIDRTTGSLVGMTEAQKRLRLAMVASATADMEKEIAERKENIRLLREQISQENERTKKRRVGGNGGLTSGVVSETALNASSAKLRGIRDQIEAERRSLEQAEARLGVLNEGGEVSRDAVDGRGLSLADVESERALIEKLAQIREAEAKKQRTRMQEEITQINRFYDEKKAALEALIAIEEKRTEAERVLPLGSLEEEVVGVAAQRAEAIKRIEDEAAREKNARAMRDFQAQQAEGRRVAAERSGEDKANAREIERLRILASKKGVDQRLALIDLAHKHELEDMKELGVAVDGINKKYELRKQLLSAADEAKAEAVQGTIVSFNARALQGFAGAAQKVQDRIAAAAEETAENTRRILDKPSGGLKYT